MLDLHRQRDLFYEQPANHTTSRSASDRARPHALPAATIWPRCCRSVSCEPLALPARATSWPSPPGWWPRSIERNRVHQTADAPAQLRDGYVQRTRRAMRNWWIPSGRVFYSPKATDAPPQELAYARQPLLPAAPLPRSLRQTTFVSYDSDDANPQKNHNLLVVKTEDAVGNTVTARQRLSRPAAHADDRPQRQPLRGAVRRTGDGRRHGGDGQGNRASRGRFA